MTDRLIAIFEKQRELAHKFTLLEMQNHTLETEAFPVDIQDRKGQMLLRRYAWQITEEICEALMARDFAPEEFEIEVADAFHFIIEMALHIGLSPASLVESVVAESGSPGLLEGAWQREVVNLTPLSIAATEAWMNVILDLALLMNKLKNRPWRTDHRPTDPVTFLYHFQAVFRSFLQACIVEGLTLETLCASYFGKAEINEQRYEALKS